MYRLLFDLLFKRMDPEKAHQLAFTWIRVAAAVPGVRTVICWLLAPKQPTLRIHALGRDMAGPFGLAAGFDKNALGVDALSMLGFDHVEVGTVTAQPQPGNPRPRLFRLAQDRALINRLGFNNDGCAAVAERLAARSNQPWRRDPVVGVNIGKTKAVAEKDAVADYAASAERLAPHAHYLVVNVSSPNTPGLRDLQAVDQLGPLLAAVRAAADRAQPARTVPLLVKIAPDLADDAIDAIADLAVDLGLAGLIATNTTIAREGLTADPTEVRDMGPGGLSGAPLKERSLTVLRRVRARVGDRLTLVSVGGVETADDVWDRLISGATLVQGYSGFVYAGPLWARRIHRGLAARLAASPHASLAEAVGSAVAPTSPAAPSPGPGPAIPPGPDTDPPATADDPETVAADFSAEGDQTSPDDSRDAPQPPAGADTAAPDDQSTEGPGQRSAAPGMPQVGRPLWSDTPNGPGTRRTEPSTVRDSPSTAGTKSPEPSGDPGADKRTNPGQHPGPRKEDSV